MQGVGGGGIRDDACGVRGREIKEGMLGTRDEG